MGDGIREERKDCQGITNAKLGTFAFLPQANQRLGGGGFGRRAVW